MTQNLASLTNYKNLLLKLGERGVFSVSNANRQKPMEAQSFTIPTFVSKVELPDISKEKSRRQKWLQFII